MAPDDALVRMLRTVSVWAAMAPLAVADSVALTGILPLKDGGQAALLYFPASEYGVRIPEGQERLGVKLLSIDAAKGTVQISRDGHEETLHLGGGVAAPAALAPPVPLPAREGDKTRLTRFLNRPPDGQHSELRDLRLKAAQEAFLQTLDPRNEEQRQDLTAAYERLAAVQRGDLNPSPASPGTPLDATAADAARDDYSRRLAEAMARARSTTGVDAHPPVAKPGRP